jgi:hypothetical protein
MSQAEEERGKMHTMTDQDSTRYNGWANRETWLANLWITNEEWSYNAARELARDTADNWEPIEVLADYYGDVETRRLAIIVAVGDALDEWATETFLDAIGAEGFVADLLNTAWGRIDWREIAEGMLEQ